VREGCALETAVLAWQRVSLHVQAGGIR